MKNTGHICWELTMTWTEKGGQLIQGIILEHEYVAFTLYLIIRYQRIVNWVSDAWENGISSDIIKKAFIQNGLPQVLCTDSDLDRNYLSQADNDWLVKPEDLHSRLKDVLEGKELGDKLDEMENSEHHIEYSDTDEE